MKLSLVGRLTFLASCTVVMFMPWGCSSGPKTERTTSAEPRQADTAMSVAPPGPPPMGTADTAALNTVSDGYAKPAPVPDTVAEQRISPGKLHWMMRRQKIGDSSLVMEQPGLVVDSSSAGTPAAFDTSAKQSVPRVDNKLVFDWPGRMNIDESYQVHLAIATHMQLVDLKAMVDSLVIVDSDTSGQHRRRHIKVNVRFGHHMRAELTGASKTDPNVTIALPPDDDGNRTIDQKNDTSVVWSWTVTPHKAGPLRLTMYLTRVDEHDSQPVDIHTVLVQGVEPGTFDKITTFLTKINALYLLLSTGIVGTLARLVWNWWADKKKATPNSTAANNGAA